jgi:hypothetical protein
VLNRLDAIEAFLSLDSQQSPAATQQHASSHVNQLEDPSSLGLWVALARLRQSPRQALNSEIWSQNTVKRLWLEYYFLKI